MRGHIIASSSVMGFILIITLFCLYPMVMCAIGFGIFVLGSFVLMYCVIYTMVTGHDVMGLF